MKCLLLFMIMLQFYRHHISKAITAPWYTCCTLFVTWQPSLTTAQGSGFLSSLRGVGIFSLTFVLCAYSLRSLKMKSSLDIQNISKGEVFFAIPANPIFYITSYHAKVYLYTLGMSIRQAKIFKCIGKRLFSHKHDIILPR